MPCMTVLHSFSIALFNPESIGAVYVTVGPISTLKPPFRHDDRPHNKSRFVGSEDAAIAISSGCAARQMGICAMLREKFTPVRHEMVQ